MEWFSASPNSFGVNLEPPEGDVQGPLFRGRKGQEFLHGLCRSFVSKVESVQRDNKLTAEGKRDGIEREAGRLLAELRGNYRRFLDPLVNAFVNFDSTHLAAVRRAVDPLEAIERLRVQQYISALEVKERVELLKNALAENDSAVLGVFFDRPKLHRLLDPEFIAEMRRQYLAKQAPGVVQAETAGAVLVFDFEKATDELSLFAGPGVNADAVEIYKHLAEVKKIGMSFEPNADLRMMQSGAVSSSLPALSGMVNMQPA